MTFKNAISAAILSSLCVSCISARPKSVRIASINLDYSGKKCVADIEQKLNDAHIIYFESAQLDVACFAVRDKDAIRGRLIALQVAMADGVSLQ